LPITANNNMNFHIINNKLPWNGKYLGQYTTEDIDKKWEFLGKMYMSLRTSSGLLYFIYMKYKDGLPLIIDDLRLLFGLRKRGIHLIKIDNILYIIYKVIINENGDIVYDINVNTLSTISKELFKSEIVKSFIFSDLIGLRNIKENSLMLRTFGNKITILNNNYSHVDSCKNYDYNGCMISNNILNKWFNDVDMSHIVREMIGCNYNSIFLVEKICMTFRRNINNVIDKYDKKYVWLSNFIMEKLFRHLS
jgi:hypothetical protein